MLLHDQAERRPVQQMALPMLAPDQNVTDGWLHRKPLLSGEFELSLHSEYMTTLAPMKMIDHLKGDPVLGSRHYIVAMEWSKTYAVEICCPNEVRGAMDRAWLLEELTADLSMPEVKERQRVWKTLAVMAGILLRSRIGVDETRLVIAQAQKEPALIDAALAMRAHWPLGFRTVEGAARDLLLAQANRSRSSDHSTLGIGPIVFNDMRLFAPATVGIASEVEPLASRLEETAMNDSQVADAAPIDEPSTTGQATPTGPVDQIDVPGPLDLGDRLSSPMNHIVTRGLTHHTFSYVGHEARLFVPWSIVLTIPQHRRNHGLAYDLVIRRDIDPERYITNSCVLAVGHHGDGDKKVSNSLGILWRAVAACFGINAVSNGHFAVQPFTHPRTLKALRKSPAKALEFIDAWPIVEHGPLKELARARARAAALGKVTPMTQAQVDALAASASKGEADHSAPEGGAQLEDDIDNESCVESSASPIAEAPTHTSSAVDIDTEDLDAIPETIPMSHSTQAEAASPDAGAISTPTTQARARRPRTVPPAPPTAESMIDVALGANRRARDALKADIDRAGQEIVNKRALIERLESEVIADQDKFAAKSKQLDQFNALIDGLLLTV